MELDASESKKEISLEFLPPPPANVPPPSLLMPPPPCDASFPMPRSAKMSNNNNNEDIAPIMNATEEKQNSDEADIASAVEVWLLLFFCNMIASYDFVCHFFSLFLFDFL